MAKIKRPPGTKGSPGEGALAEGRVGQGHSITIRNPYPLALLGLLLLVLLYCLTWLAGISKPQTVYLGDAGPPSCAEGQTKSCVVGNCSGVSTCSEGVWGGCKWAHVCRPGDRQVCLTDNCPSGIKTCNACGTAFGPCTAS